MHQWSIACDNSWSRQNLKGVLPRSLSRLPYIKSISLSRNLLTGTIPREWTSTRLNLVYLSANCLSGPIPDYLGNISTLEYLNLAGNQFNGTIPPEVGKLINLNFLILADNVLTGSLPVELKKLNNLTYLLLSSNNFSGHLPDYFQNWTKLEVLEIQGSGFEGPISSSISLLKNAQKLIISDLSGEASTFPDLQNLTELSVLVLRSCKITGEIPSFLRKMKNLSYIDLSFNKLKGSVPVNPVTDHLYLTSNMLSGLIPCWMFATDDSSHIDLSYNNFDDTLAETSCGKHTLNLYRSNARQKTLDSSSCLKNSKCLKARYSLHINCGGPEARIGNITFERDNETKGAATFFRSDADWGFSSSGEFQPGDFDTPNYTTQSTSTLKVNRSDAELYKNARLAATSLTYYGRCLAKGNYTVTLYFSEIVLNDSDSYTRLGRRVFDIYIQEILHAKDFDIVKEANGTNKARTKIYTNIPVTNSLEIRFYYAGKGSTNFGIGTYGPLISAISVKSQFNPPFNWKIVRWVLIGTTTSLLSVVLGFIWWKRRMVYIYSREQELRLLNPHIGLFTYKQIKTACNNFNEASKIGEGGFGSVYKGTLMDGTNIAVKQLSAKSSQGNREFVNEIGMVSSLYHPNLVRLYGCCIDTSQLVLVYEYMENKDLGHALFGSGNGQLRLDWPTRKKICIGIARGLAFLHEESRIKMVHRDIKATNVLLDRDLNPKISDFGLARLNEEENTHISTQIAGTVGYMAPEYALQGYLTPKADVYSFGIIVLEVMAGRSNTKFQPEEDHFCLLDWPLVKQRGDLMELMDSTLGTNYNMEEASMIIQVALLCANPSPSLRPTMSAALSMLEGNTELPELILEPTATYQRVYQTYKEDLELMSESETQNLMHSFDTPRVKSSSKFPEDLYPVDTLSLKFSRVNMRHTFS